MREIIDHRAGLPSNLVLTPSGLVFHNTVEHIKENATTIMNNDNKDFNRMMSRLAALMRKKATNMRTVIF